MAPQNISLEKKSQTVFTKAVKNLKKFMKKNEALKPEFVKTKARRPVIGNKDGADKQRKSHLGRGVVYLRHIPHGFYENEMRDYFSQFGCVTRLNVVRSKKTGKPKGFAFIEFLYSEVAQVVAETMNNYLMFNKLLKAEYIPGEKVQGNTFLSSRMNPSECFAVQKQKKYIENLNKKLTEDEVAELTARDLKWIQKLKKNLAAKGLEFECQVEGMPLPDKNKNSPSKAILELDESDTEIEYKVHPNVLKVLKRKSSAAVSPASNKKTRVDRPTPSPEKKRMSLLEGLKNRKKMEKFPEAQQILDKTPVLKISRLDQSLDKSSQKQAKSTPATLKKTKKENIFPAQNIKKEVNETPIRSPKKENIFLAQNIKKEVNETPIRSPKKERNETPIRSPKKEIKTPLVKKSQDSSTKKVARTLDNWPASAKKAKKTPLFAGKRNAFSTSKKCGIPRLVNKKIVKMKSPK